MKYWTLFTVRMLARVGLATSLLLWLVPQCSHTLRIRRQISTLDVELWSTAGRIDVAWTDTTIVPREGGYMPSRLIHLPGVEFREFKILGSGHLILDHWLICLTFLIAVIVTGVRWRRPVAVQEDDG